MPSIVSYLVAGLTVAGRVASQNYTLSKTYDASNFLDEFDFLTTGTVPTQPDDNWSWVTYQNRTNAVNKGLASVKNGRVYLGVDHTTVLPSDGPGRPSLRVQSKAWFKHGLIITRFTHMPKPVCGGWPAYWSLGDGHWPMGGEIDMYEGWHLHPANKPALHVGPESVVGRCTLDQSAQGAQLVTGNCDNEFADNVHQWKYQGCQSEETRNNIWGSPKGGVQALEWNNGTIKLYTWPTGTAPRNIGSAHPDTSSWGTPSVQLTRSGCDTETAFAKQKLLFTLPFCGNPPGNDLFWSQLSADGKNGPTCKKITGAASCIDYVAKNPRDFKGFYFKLKDIRIFT